MYAEKADGRRGGVGTETQIISSQVYSKADQNKFVAAVISELDAEGRPFVPTYYASRIFIDLSSEELYSENFEALVRWISQQAGISKATSWRSGLRTSKKIQFSYQQNLELRAQST